MKSKQRPFLFSVWVMLAILLSTSTAFNSVSWTSESITSTKSTTTSPTTEIVTNIDTTTENPTSETVTNIESTTINSATETATNIESTTKHSATETATNIESPTINSATETTSYVQSTGSPPESTTSTITETTQQVTTATDKTTTEATTTMTQTACPTSSSECGYHSMMGICNDFNSVCSIFDNDIDLWTCSCTLGYTFKTDRCVKVPERIFTSNNVTKEIDKDLAPGDLVTRQIMDHMIGFNMTLISATIYGKDSVFFSVNVLNDSYIEVRILDDMYKNKSRYELIVLVKVSIDRIAIQDHLNLTLRIKTIGYTHATLVDGMPYWFVVGRLFVHRDFSYQYEIQQQQNSTEQLPIFIDQWGYIRTSQEINFDAIFSLPTIAGSEIYDVFIKENGKTFMAYRLHVFFFRKYFIINEQLEENSSANTTLGYFNIINQTMNVHHDQFMFDSGKLLLGNVTLDYQNRPEVTEIIEISTLIGIGLNRVNVTIQFKVKDTNDKFPFFLREPYHFVITKCSPKDMIVGVVEGSDPDTDSVLSFTINPNDRLAINNNGIITLKQNITADKYTATITVNDGLHANSTDITILGIETELTNLYLGKSYNGSLNENTMSPNIVSLNDKNDTIYENYVFKDSPQAENNFHLNSTTGVISNKRTFDRENINERLFHYSVVANKINEACSVVVLGEVVITVLNLNDNPPTFPTNQYFGYVKEELPNEKLRFQIYPGISANDLDEKTTLEYSLVDGKSSFSINKATAEIMTTRSLDREFNQTMTITVVASDGKHRSNATVMITIEDINDNSPNFTIANNFSLYENTSLGKVSRVLALDPDEGINGDVTYTIDSQKGYFQINRDNGDILLAGKLDREDKNLHEIHITARDHGTPQLSTTTTLFVEVLDVNDNAPVFRTHEIRLEVDENNNCSQSVMTVNAADKDCGKNGQIQFEFVGNDTNYAGLDMSLTGTITCSQSFDYEQETFRNLYVRARDLGTPPLSSTQLITVIIKDLNDNIPQFSNVIERLEVRYYQSNHERVVAVVKAFDLDSSNKLSFSLSGNASNFLYIDDRGILSTNTTYIPIIGSYDLNISVSDSKHYNVMSLTVHILEPSNSDEQVRFSRQVINMSIPENKMSGTPIFNISSLLLTSDNSLTYMYNFLEKDNNAPFSLSREFGEVKNTEVLDREKIESFEFVVYVHASNDTEILDLAMVNVTVEDTNDNRPEFVKPHGGYFFEVNENEPIGTLVKPKHNLQNIAATDADIGENAVIEYRLVNDPACKSWFAINDSTGLLSLKNEIDYEITEHCELKIMAVNPQDIYPRQDFDEITVTVSVLDINDNAPKFQENTFSLQYKEDTRTDRLLPPFGIVTDKDDRENADVEVRVISPESCPFTVHVAKYLVATGDGTKTPFVDHNLGSVHELSISLTTALDYDKGEITSSCIIVAIDKAEDSRHRLNSTATITIEITDVNDNDPKVDVDSIRVDIPRYAWNGEVFVVVDKINATDIDSGDNGEIYFRFDMTDEPIMNGLSINEKSGQITLNSSLEYYNQDEVKLTVVVSDKGDPPRMTKLLVTIGIEDDNARPYFNSDSSLVADITEHRLGFNHKFRAFDVVNDVDSVCDCYYEIVSVNVDRYKDMLDVKTYVDYSSGIKFGEIRFENSQSSFDREDLPDGTLTVTVKATDHGDPRKSETADLKIIVADINDQAPFFEVPGYEFHIYQHVQIGSYIGAVSALDRDEDPLTSYRMNITDPEFNHTLTIGKTTGVITKSDDMNITGTSDVQIKGFVYAKDDEEQSFPEDHAFITITVKYFDKNFNTPYFISDTTMDVITTEATPTQLPCDNNGLNRTDVALDQECGPYSSTGRCTKRYSACTLVEGSPDAWLCKCSKGYAKTNDECKKVPSRLWFGNNEYNVNKTVNSPVGDNVLTVQFSEVSDFPRTVENEVIKDYIDVKVTVSGFNFITESIVILDGTPAESVVGHLCPSCLPNGGITNPNNLLSVFNDGVVQTTTRIDLDILQSVDTIAYSTQIDVKNNNNDLVARITLTIVRSEYIIDVPEDGTSETVVGKFHLLQTANIANLGPSGFTVNSNNHLLLGTNKLDYTLAQTVQRTLELEGLRDLKVYVPVFMQVIDVNNKPPTFSEPLSYQFTILESAYPGIIVGAVQATDIDTNADLVLKYSISPNDKLTIDNQGVIKIKSANFTQTSYNTTVTVSDGKFDVSVGAQFKIIQGTTLNLNQSFSGAIPENTNVGAFIVIAAVTDYSQYTFTDFSAGVNFNINRQTGEVTTSRPFDRESKDSYQYTVVGHKTNQVTCSLVVIGELRVTIEDVNDEAPVFINGPYSASVPEGSVGTSLLMSDDIATTDKDTNSTVMYSIVNSNGMFSINSNTGKITTATPIDREATSTVEVTIEASDGVNTATTKVTVNITDINDNTPTFTKAESFTTREDTQPNTVVYTVEASDRDEGRNAEITFDLESDRGFFTINQTTGEIRTLRRLDRESSSSHTIRVFARDNGDSIQSVQKQLTVTISDVNDNPPLFDSAQTSVTVQENRSCTTDKVSLNAVDADEPNLPNSQVVYSISSGGDNFTIDASTGDLRCKSVFDFESQQSYTIEVMAKDNGTPSLSSTLTVVVNVEDINDNAPVFINPSTSVTIRYLPNSPLSKIVEVLSVTDEDSNNNGKVTFTLSGTAESFLSIDSKGVIRTKAASNQPAGTYQLTIMATDGGSPPLSRAATMSIIVQHISTQPVKFTKQEIQMNITENSNINDQLRSVTGDVLADSGLTLQYEIFDTVADLPFTIGVSNGMVSVAGSIDREFKNLYEFVVKVKNQAAATESDLVVVKVSIIDVNDNKPIFVQQTTHFYKISEDKEINSEAVAQTGQLKATDLDEGTNAEIDFRIEEATGCVSHFDLRAIDSNTRSIILKAKVDYEQMQLCTFSVMAYNRNNINMNSTTDVTVSITDYNDNSPVFGGHTSGVYKVDVPEDITINTEAITIGDVTDADDRENGDVDVDVTTIDCWFDVVKTGNNLGIKLKTGISLDFESKNISNNCTLKATDKARSPMPVRSSTALLSITLIDMNDNAPQISSPAIVVTVERDADTGFTIVDNIPATDLDSGKNGEIKYSIRESEYSSRFIINATNGHVALNSPLTSVQKDKVTLAIIVSDKGVPPKAVEMKITINITDRNPRPYFTDSGEAKVAEHSVRGGGVIHTITAFDRKDGISFTCDCKYYIDTERDDITIEQHSGVIKFRNPDGTLDREREKNGRVEFGIIAEDKDLISKNSSTLLFVINIIDINDQNPTFDQPEYSFAFHQNTKDGTIFGQITATDLDMNPKTKYSINITDGMFKDVIEINPTTGHLIKRGNTTLTDVQDAEIEGFVFAQDGLDSQKKPSSTTIKIKIEYDDNNFYKPTFVQATYSGNLNWEAAALTHIVTVLAIDADNGTQGEIDYTIVSGNTRNFFQINENGLIYLEYLLDSSLGTDKTVTVNLTVKAADRSIIPKFSYATVRISITGNNPGFCIQGAAHSKQVNDITTERRNFSTALYVLVAILCVALIACFFLLYKWRTSTPAIGEEAEPTKYNQDKKGKGLYVDFDEYEQLQKYKQRASEMYSSSNQGFYNQGFDPPQQNVNLEDDKTPYNRPQDVDFNSTFRDSAEPMPDYPNDQESTSAKMVAVLPPRPPSSYAPSPI